MAENQNIEYKSAWRDEYLRWICGFANAQGGTLYVGKDDKGDIAGVQNAQKLLEELPNKIAAVLGIIADVNLHETAQGDYLEIVVEQYPSPVNYKGEYHCRTGSTKQELKGAALDKFLLQKFGRRWDSVLVPNVGIADLKQETFDFFKTKGIKSNRIDESSKDDTPKQVLDNLKLMENDRIKRAAVLLFHPDPEKFVTGAFVKIGFFRTDSDLLFQDEIHGNLFEQVEKTMELLLTKYTKALISYEGISRVETYEYPKEALREALLNAITHKDYAGCVPIQISVYANRIMIWNEGQLPENWTVKNLFAKHSSRPYNPDIANAFFRSGYIEAWGRGIEKITGQCLAAGLPEPIFKPEGSDFWVIFRKDIYYKEDLSKLGLNERQIKAVLYVREKGKITNKEYQAINHISRQMATNELHHLANVFKMLVNRGYGAGSYFELVN
jgi:ATP-dependent DNA helicase RecG